MSAADRFWPRVVEQPSGCWLWTGALASTGYGVFYADSTAHFAHRWAYEAMVGPIPEGLVVDHLCKNRACVNPGHFDIVPLAVNSGRNTHAEKVACTNGHPFTEANTYLWRGHRKCRACNRANVARHKARAALRVA